MKTQIHVVPNGNKWSVKESGRSAPISNHRTQSNAINSGKPIAIKDRTELVIHRPDGKIRDKDSYGPDPSWIKDKKH